MILLRISFNSDRDEIDYNADGGISEIAKVELSPRNKASCCVSRNMSQLKPSWKLSTTQQLSQPSSPQPTWSNWEEN